MEIVSNSSLLALTNRSTLSLSGVDKVIEVSEKLLSLEVCGSGLTIEGENMNVQKLDVENKILEVKGKINAIKYHSKKEKVNFIKRIFK